MANLIILRGNSGSGKTSTAQLLQERLGEGTLLISQDVVRRQMLRVKDKVGSLSTDLIENLVTFGMERCHFVLLEGIFTNRKHGEMLGKIVKHYGSNVYVYYFDISFKETLKRHQFKNVDFGEREMREWYLDKDVLGVNGEVIFSDEWTHEEIINRIMSDIIE